MPFDAPNEKVDPLEAIDYFKGRLDLPDDVAKALDAESRAKAFWVSGITDVDILTDVHDALNRALEKGTTYEDFLAEVGDKLEDAWGGDVRIRDGGLRLFFATLSKRPITLDVGSNTKR